MDTYEFEKYITNMENLKDTIERFGVAIIPSVLTNDECENMVSGIWDYFEHITQSWQKSIKRDDPSSWREIYKLFPIHSMLFQYFGVGQCQASWNLRQNEKIVNIFSELWKCPKEQLLVSFDGLSFSMPHEITKRGWNREKTWYHTDQSYLRNGFECIQSWVTGLDVNEGDATLGIMEGSNMYHEECAKTFNITEKSDWFKLSRQHEEFYLSKGCNYKKIKCPAGSLVFWDSRTIHCGIEAMKQRQIQNMRAVVYLCYTPRQFASKTILKKRIKAFEEGRATSHWPHKSILFGKNPRTYGAELPIITPIRQPSINRLGRILVGYEADIHRKKIIKIIIQDQEDQEDKVE